jgi:hypothetical protein
MKEEGAARVLLWVLLVLHNKAARMWLSRSSFDSNECVYNMYTRYSHSRLLSHLENTHIRRLEEYSVLRNRAHLLPTQPALIELKMSISDLIAAAAPFRKSEGENTLFAVEIREVPRAPRVYVFLYIELDRLFIFEGGKVRVEVQVKGQKDAAVCG